MGRNLVGFCGLLVAIGFACQLAQAGDLKSTTRSHETKTILIAPEAHAAVISYENRGTPAVGVFENGYPVSTTRGSNKGRENAPPR
jgi:hypothetical protein